MDWYNYLWGVAGGVMLAGFITWPIAYHRGWMAGFDAGSKS